MVILAIDQGTSSTRLLVLEENGQSSLTQSIDHQQIYPQQNWVEHDPEELIANIQRCIHASTEKFKNITSIGIDNQGESCLAWHADTKQAISPVIVWQDSRSQKAIDTLKEKGYEQKILALSGLPLDSYFSASKLAWIIQHIPDAKQLLNQGKLKLGTTDAFFLDRLTGHCVTDITTASRTSLMNLKTGEWDKELCSTFNIPIQCLPKIVSTQGDFGSITSNGQKIPILASVCDQQAALFGHGCRQPGDAKIRSFRDRPLLIAVSIT